MTASASTALHTDRYELTMLDAALRDGTAERRCVFELFGRRLSGGRRFGVVAGTGRLVELIRQFRFGDDESLTLGPGGFARVDPATVRSFRNVSDAEDAVYVCVGGAGGYVGRDGLLPDGETRAR